MELFPGRENPIIAVIDAAMSVPVTELFRRRRLSYSHTLTKSSHGFEYLIQQAIGTRKTVLPR